MEEQNQRNRTYFQRRNKKIEEVLDAIIEIISNEETKPIVQKIEVIAKAYGKIIGTVLPEMGAPLAQMKINAINALRNAGYPEEVAIMIIAGK